MSLINFSVKHNKTQDEARRRLEEAVTDIRSRFAAMVDRVEWSDDRNTVKIFGKGIEVEIWIDATYVYLRGDVPLLGALLGGPLAKGLKTIVEHNFQKRLN